MNGYVRRSNKKRLAILEAAQALFFDRGFTDVSVSEIAAAARVSQVTIYNYFGSKDNLLREVMSTYMTSALDQVEALLALEIPFAEKLTRWLAEGQTVANSFSQRFFDSIPWSDPATQELYKELAYTKAFPLMQRLFEQGKQEGAIDPTVPTEVIMAYMAALMPILTNPDFMKTSMEYKEGFQKLFFFGLIGK